MPKLEHAARLSRALERGPAELLNLRNEAIACLALPGVVVEQEWEGNSPGTNGLGFDAAFERYAWSFQEEGIRVRRLADHVELVRLPTPRSDCVSRWVYLSFSRDGRYLAAFYGQWTEKRPLEVWDLADGAGRRIVAVPDASALPAFAADGKSLVALLPTGEAAIIELPSGQERRRLASGGPAQALALQPGGKLLAVAGGESAGVRVLDLLTGSIAHRLPHPDTVQRLAWSGDGKLLATACNDGRIRLWDTATWEKLSELTGHRWEVGDVTFDSTGKWLASFGWDMTLRIWEIGSRRQVLNVEDIRVLGFRSQGGLAAAGVTGQRVQVWGFQPSEVFQQLYGFRIHHPACDFGPGGRWLMTMTGAEGDLRVWDTRTCRQIFHRPAEFGSLCCDTHGAWLLSRGADGFRRAPVLVDTVPGGEPLSFRFGESHRLAGLQEDVRRHVLIRVGPEGRRFLLVDPYDSPLQQFRVRLLQVDAETIRVLWENWKLKSGHAAASPDGRLVAVGSYGGGSGVSIWEAATGRLVQELSIGDARMAFARDSRRLYTVTGGLSPRAAECRSWWLSSWEPDRELPLKRTSHSPAHLTVAADGTVAVVFTMSDVRLLDPETLAQLATLSAPEPGLLQSIRFSSDATKLAASASGSVQLWDLRRLRQELAALGLDWNAAPLPPENRKP